MKKTELSTADRDRTIRRMIGKEFDYKACLIWTAIAVISVFGIVHLGKILFARSEITSEKYRLSQRMSLLTTLVDGNNGGSSTSTPSSPIVSIVGHQSAVAEKTQNKSKEFR